MDQKQSHVWYTHLRAVTEAYNNSVHRSIKTTPQKATKLDDYILWNRLYGPKPIPVKKVKKSEPPKTRSPYKLKVGDQVKLTFIKHVFSREYGERWTSEFFFITTRSVKQGLPLYTLKDWNNDPIQGTFYEKELQIVRTDDETKYNIEKIIKKRTRKGVREVFVKWQGWRDNFNTWIPESEAQGIES